MKTVKWIGEILRKRKIPPAVLAAQYKVSIDIVSAAYHGDTAAYLKLIAAGMPDVKCGTVTAKRRPDWMSRREYNIFLRDLKEFGFERIRL